MSSVSILPIEDLTPDPRNARVHGPENQRAIRASVGRFGPARSIVLDGANVVRAGNGTLEAARQEGIREVVIIEPAPGQLVAVRRPDWSDSQAAAYALADNRAAESATWQELVLAETLDRLPDDDREATGFSQTDVENLLERLASERAGTLDGSDIEPSGDATAGLLGGQNEATTVPDPAPADRHAELVAKWGVQPGQLWSIPSVASPGRSHALLCGDCRNADDVRRACGLLGGRVNGAVTSPPYAEQRSGHYRGIPASDYVEWFQAVQSNVRAVLADDASFFVNIKAHSEAGQRNLYVLRLVLTMVDSWGWSYIDEFCWRRSGVPGAWPNRLKNQFEPVHQFAPSVKIKFRPDNVAYPSDDVPRYDGVNHNANGFPTNAGRTPQAGMAHPGNVLEVAAEKNLSNLHSAPFPVGIPAFFVRAYSDPGDTWLDPFMGSGTTFLACEQNDRLAIGIEERPEHVAVILERLSQAGLTPTLV